MTALLPTRVSLYDFLYQDTRPIDALIADHGHISLPQARLIIESGIQAIVSALLAYHQNLGAESVLKKLLQRNQIKELRKYNAFNFKTMHTAMQHGQNISDSLFATVDVQKAVCKKLGQKVDLSAGQVRPLLGGLSLLCLREIAILVDFAQLDATEIDIWFQQQPQFLRLNRTLAHLTLNRTESNNSVCDAKAYKLPSFEISWCEMVGYHLPETLVSPINAEQLPHYAKVIGRTTQMSQTSNLITDNGQLIVDKDNKSDILTFCTMDNIVLPYQRWLLQLAKISDIYLSRNRLKIAPEPEQPPSRPLVSFGFLDKDINPENTKGTNLADSNHDKMPFWKNPVLILLVLIIGALSLLAIGKYHYKKSNPMQLEQSQPVVIKKADNH